MADPLASYHSKRQRLQQQFAAQAKQALRLEKNTSNLFRDRQAHHGATLQVGDFDQVIAMDIEAQWVEVEGMCQYQHLTAACLQHGMMPCVVPQLKTITIGGAVSGIGIESTSFRHGLPHETVLEMDILLASGDVVTASANNEYADLFHGIPNSYGTLGYILRLKIKTLTVSPYVRLQYDHWHAPEDFFSAIDTAIDDPHIDFLDAVIFDQQSHVRCQGTLVDEAPYRSDYSYKHIYYRSLLERQQDYLSIADYIWRWDTDWFWCSKNLFAQHPLLRRLLGPKRLNSAFYTRVMRFNSRYGLTRKLNALRGNHPESVIQDVDIPIAKAGEFARFFHQEIGIKPLWACPIHHLNHSQHFTLYPLDPQQRYINFGFWDTVDNKSGLAAGHFNQLVSNKVIELEGIQSLYSSLFLDRDTFWQQYNGNAYAALKAKYDPHGRFKNLYDKVVLGH